MNRSSRRFAGLSLIILCGLAPTAGADYPHIRYTMVSRDALYRQHQDDVKAWYSEKSDIPPLMIFTYEPRSSEDLFAVAAAFNLPYDTLATLNGWDAPGLLSPGRKILIPNAPGLFLPAKPVGAWEQFLNSNQREGEPIVITVNRPDETGLTLRFYLRASFSPNERGRFLGALFSSPLRGGILTSGFGFRIHPVTGAWHHHPGVDIRIPLRSPVRAARKGRVSDSGRLSTYGLFVILDHDGGYQTVYAHLDEIRVVVGQTIGAGDMIALSGNSGITTGPHLHFEIRRQGKPMNPALLTNLNQ